MADTTIEWTRNPDGTAGKTWNPLVGCQRVSEGCDHCYAIPVVHRQMSPQHKGLTIVTDDGVDWTGDVNISQLSGGGPATALDAPSRWRKPQRIFVNSLSDPFYAAAQGTTVHVAGIGQVQLDAVIVAEMVANPRHTFMVLTKRPQIMAVRLTNLALLEQVNTLLSARGAPLIPKATPPVWPPHIIWVTSIELDKYSFRADYLRLIQGTTGISAEPLLGPLPRLNLDGINWVIAGGESGPKARPMHLDWVRDLRDRATGHRTKKAYSPEMPGCDGSEVLAPDPVAFFFKQHGAWRPMRLDEVPAIGGNPVVVQNGSKPDQPMVTRHYEPAHVIRSMIDDPRYSWRTPMVKAPKHENGRDLDGRTWDEFADEVLDVGAAHAHRTAA